MRMSLTFALSQSLKYRGLLKIWIKKKVQGWDNIPTNGLSIGQVDVA